MNNIEEFRAGVTACLRSWSALRTAVESGWGGGERESQTKAEDLRNNIFRVLDGTHCPPPNYDVQDLADNLAIFMEEEFSITLEDGSEQQVAQTMFRMYEDWFNGNPALARQMVVQADSAVAMSSQFPVQLQTTEHDMDDDEMADTEDGVPQLTNAPPAPVPSDYNTVPLFGTAPKVVVPTGPVRQLGEAPPEKPTVEMDDDGFAPVKQKGRRR